MAERFVLLRGTPDGPVFLARPDHPDDAAAWTADRDGAMRFDDRAAADAERVALVARDVIAVAVVPEASEKTRGPSHRPPPRG